MIDRYAEAVRMDDGKHGHDTASELAREEKGSLFNGQRAGGVARHDSDNFHGKDYVKPIERIMAETVSSNFVRKLKDRNISSMQTVEIEESVQGVKINEGVSMYGGGQ